HAVTVSVPPASPPFRKAPYPHPYSGYWTTSSCFPFNTLSTERSSAACVSFPFLMCRSLLPKCCCPVRTLSVPMFPGCRLRRKRRFPGTKHPNRPARLYCPHCLCCFRCWHLHCPSRRNRQKCPHRNLPPVSVLRLAAVSSEATVLPDKRTLQHQLYSDHWIRSPNASLTVPQSHRYLFRQHKCPESYCRYWNSPAPSSPHH